MRVGLLGGVFEGQLSSDGGKIIGTWTQSRIPLELTLERTDPKADQAEQAAAAAKEAEKDYSHTVPNDLTGHWTGVIDVKGAKVPVALHVARLPNGDLSASLNNVGQGTKGVPADAVRFASLETHLEWTNLGATYDGTMKNGKITGTWRQGGQEFPLIFERSKTP